MSATLSQYTSSVTEAGLSGFAFATVVALAPVVLRTPAASIPVPPAISALAAGAALGALSWPVLAAVGERAALSKAVMCGLVVAQGMLVPRTWLAMSLVVLVLLTYFRDIEQ